MQTSADENRALVARAFAAWRDGAGGPFDLLADDTEWTITGNCVAAGDYPSRGVFMSKVIRPFNARMRTSLKPTIRQIFAEGEMVIAFFDASGVALDGETYENTYAWFLQMRDGRIVRAHAFFDAIAFDSLWRRVRPA